jgi:RNA polymerase sigma-70 factor (ECF subfamily)
MAARSVPQKGQGERMHRDDALEHNPLITPRALEQLNRDAFLWAMNCVRGVRAEAEDVLQQTYLAILEGSARFDGAASLRTFLYSVVRQVAAARRRRTLRLGDLLAHWFDREEPLAPVPGIDGAAAVRSALRRLPLRQREALELVFYREFTVAEAARIMGVSIGTARVHYDRAKRSLAAMLSRDLLDD